MDPGRKEVSWTLQCVCFIFLGFVFLFGVCPRQIEGSEGKFGLQSKRWTGHIDAAELACVANKATVKRSCTWCTCLVTVTTITRKVRFSLWNHCQTEVCWKCVATDAEAKPDADPHTPQTVAPAQSVIAMRLLHLYCKAMQDCTTYFTFQQILNPCAHNHDMHTTAWSVGNQPIHTLLAGCPTYKLQPSSNTFERRSTGPL